MATKKTSTAVAVKPANSVVSVKEMMAAQLAALGQKTAVSTGNAIRVTQDKQFILPDGSKTPDPIQVVIVDFTSCNEFYEGAFDPKNITPPACFALGDIPTTLVPSANSPAKQSDSCAECPNNAFGSAGAGKACKNTRKLALLPVDAEEDTPIWTIKVSPTAIKGFDGYVKNVARMFQVPPVGVVTTLSFDENQTYAALKFSDPTPNEDAAAHLARMDEAREILAAEPDVSGFQAPVKAPGRTVKAPGRPAVARR